MPYYLIRDAIGNWPRIDIDEGEYVTLVRAKKSLVCFLGMEEEWDCVVQNFFELEMDLIESAMRLMVQGHPGHDQIHDRRLGFSRRLSNLLSACRSYLDRTTRQLGNLEETKFEEIFKTLRADQYDKNFSYRFMEALRNYAQHSGVPLHGVTFETSRDKKSHVDAKNRLRFSVTTSIDLEEVLSDPKFAKKIADQIERGTKRLDVAPLTRQYIGQLGQVHEGFRNETRADVSNWKALIRAAIARYAGGSNDSALGLAAAEFASDTSKVISKEPIFEQLLLRLENLTFRNGTLANLDERYVTNEVAPRR